MRSLVPRPILLIVTLLMVAGAIAYVELRLDATSPVAADAGQNPDPPAVKEQTEVEASTAEKEVDPPAGKKSDSEPRSSSSAAEKDREGAKEEEPEQAISDEERISEKEDEYGLAEEIVNPSGFVNADDFSVREGAGEKVILLEFWTYTCFNCQNVQPHLNSWHDAYASEGLQVVGVHTPEFGFEKEYANVEAAVGEAGIEYPVVLDNAYATWDAYDNRYWPAIYLIDADGFVRYKHFGEGAYGETEQKIQELLAEKERISS